MRHRLIVLHAAICGMLVSPCEAQRTNTDSLHGVMEAWVADHVPGDTLGLARMNRLAVMHSMRLQVDEELRVLDRAIAIGETELEGLRSGPTRAGLMRQLIDAYSLHGDALTYQGDMEAAMRSSERMYRLALDLQDSVQAAGACQSLLLECRMIEDRDRAREWARRCLRLTPRAAPVPLAQAYNEYASVLQQDGRSDSALWYWHKALALGIGGRSPITDFDILSGCFAIHLEAGSLDSAKHYLQRSRTAFAQEPSGINLSRMSVMEARYLLAMGRPTEALAQLAVSDSFALVHGMHAGRHTTQQLRSIAYALLGDARSSRMAADTALAELKRHIGLDEARRTAVLQARFEFEREQRAAKEALKAKQRILFLSWLGIAILAVAAFLLYRLYRRSERLAAQLARTNAELLRTQDRLLITEREREAEAVRSRIARDIHDELGGSLTKLALMADLLGNSDARPLPPEVNMNALGAQARALREGLNDVVWAVDPAADTAQGLIDHIVDRFARLFQGAGVALECDMHAEDPERILSPGVRRDLYLLLREAASNALAHAHARTVKVQLLLHGDRFEMEVEDDGTGLPEEVREGRGSAHLRERALSLGGELHVGAGSRGGTSVRASGLL